MESENRLIYANALKIAFMSAMASCHSTYSVRFWSIAIDAVDSMPTVDAVEVVHGKWEKQLGLDHCLVCHKVRPYDVQADVVEYWQCDYCPNCGAKMDGGQ